jgi:hypothetical protein
LRVAGAARHHEQSEQARQGCGPLKTQFLHVD